MKRGSSLKRLEDVGSLFTMKEGFQQVRGKRKWWGAGEPVQEQWGEAQCSEFMRLEGATYLLFRILGFEG